MLGNIFSNLKNKAIGAMVQRQMKNLPPEQQEMVMKIMQSNPQLFEKMAHEVEALKKTGMNEMYAGMQVMKKYQTELAAAAKPHQKIERKVIKE